jgi:hypothetical protein
MNNERMNIPDKQNILKALYKLIKNKPQGYQFKDQELEECGITPQRFNGVRDAIGKVNSTGVNILLKPFVWLFGQIANFLDTFVRIILVLAVFLSVLLYPSISEQSTEQLKNIVSEAEFNQTKYEIWQEEFKANLSRMGYRIKDGDVAKAMPDDIKEQLEVAKHWAQYKNLSVKSIWLSAPKDLNKAKDLTQIYAKTAQNYKFTIPTNSSEPYTRAGIITVAALILYIVLQSLIIAGFKSSFRRAALKRELKKVFA